MAVNQGQLGSVLSHRAQGSMDTIQHGRSPRIQWSQCSLTRRPWQHLAVGFLTLYSKFRQRLSQRGPHGERHVQEPRPQEATLILEIRQTISQTTAS